MTVFAEGTTQGRKLLKGGNNLQKYGIFFLLLKLFCKSANQNKNNFRFTTLTKYVNNQTNCHIALEKLKKIWSRLVLILLYNDTNMVQYFKTGTYLNQIIIIQNEVQHNCYLKDHN